MQTDVRYLIVLQTAIFFVQLRKHYDTLVCLHKIDSYITILRTQVKLHIVLIHFKKILISSISQNTK